MFILLSTFKDCFLNAIPIFENEKAKQSKWMQEQNSRMGTRFYEKILLAASSKTYEWFTHEHGQYMMTTIGIDTPFSKIDPSWMSNVRPHHYCTMMKQSDNSYITLLVNIQMQRCHIITVPQALIIEKQTGQEVQRRKQASSQSNRIVVSSTPLRLKCVIPECLYVSITGSSSSSSSSNAGESRSNASDVFSQTSHRVLEGISNILLRTMSDNQLYTKLTSLDETWQGFASSGADDVEGAKCRATLKYGAEAVEQMALLFILTQSKMRMRIDVDKMKLVKKEASRAKRDEERAHKHATKIEEVVDDEDDLFSVLPQRKPEVLPQPVPPIPHLNTLTLPPSKKRRRSQFSIPQQDAICLQYYHLSTDGKKKLRDSHHLEIHDLGNWKRRAEKASGLPKLEELKSEKETKEENIQEAK